MDKKLKSTHLHIKWYFKPRFPCKSVIYTLKSTRSTYRFASITVVRPSKFSSVRKEYLEGCTTEILMLQPAMCYSSAPRTLLEALPMFSCGEQISTSRIVARLFTHFGWSSQSCLLTRVLLLICLLTGFARCLLLMAVIIHHGRIHEFVWRWSERGIYLPLSLFAPLMWFVSRRFGTSIGQMPTLLVRPRIIWFMIVLSATLVRERKQAKAGLQRPLLPRA